MKTWCRCFCRGWLQCLRSNMGLCGGRRSLLWWMVPLTIGVQKPVNASAIWAWKSFWVPRIATRQLLLSCGLPTLKEAHSTQIASRLARSKYLKQLTLCLVRLGKYRSLSTSKHQQSSRIVSCYCFVTQSCIYSTTSASHLCERRVSMQ